MEQNLSCLSHYAPCLTFALSSSTFAPYTLPSVWPLSLTLMTMLPVWPLPLTLSPSGWPLPLPVSVIADFGRVGVSPVPAPTVPALTGQRRVSWNTSTHLIFSHQNKYLDRENNSNYGNQVTMETISYSVYYDSTTHMILVLFVFHGLKTFRHY